MTKRFSSWLKVGALVAMLAFVPGLALAFGTLTGDSVTLAKGKTHQGTLYASGQTVSIDGDVEGDLVCGGQTITVNGSVHGDVLCAGQTVTINGPVAGSVRAVGQSVSISNSVGRNVTVAAQSLALQAASRVLGEVGFAAQTATLNGPISHDAYGAGQNLTINAPVSGSVTTQIENLTLGASARVAGDLDYTSTNAVTLAPNKVKGDVHHHLPPQPQHPEPRQLFMAWLGNYLYWSVVGIILALLLAKLAPRRLAGVTTTMRQRPWVSLGWGALMALALPFVLIVVSLTVVGAPLALLAGVGWLVLIPFLLTKAAIAVGAWLLNQFKWHQGSVAWAGVIGVPALLLVCSVPVVGFVLGLAAWWWAAGALMLTLRASRAKS